VRRIHHVGVTVGDLKASLRFYRDLLGMRVLGVSEAEDVGAVVGVPGAQARIADLDTGDGRLLDLLDYGTGPTAGPASGPDAPGTCHVSFQVDDVHGALARLAAAGHPAIGEAVRLGGGGAAADAGGGDGSGGGRRWERRGRRWERRGRRWRRPGRRRPGRRVRKGHS